MKDHYLEVARSIATGFYADMTHDDLADILRKEFPPLALAQAPAPSPQIGADAPGEDEGAPTAEEITRAQTVARGAGYRSDGDAWALVVLERAYRESLAEIGRRQDHSDALLAQLSEYKSRAEKAEISQVQRAEGRAKWISIEDRYPPVTPDGWSDLVQICADGEVCAGYWSEPDNAWMTGHDEIPNQNRITHWCPMADPPNAKQSTPAPDATALRSK